MCVPVWWCAVLNLAQMALCLVPPQACLSLHQGGDEAGWDGVARLSHLNMKESTRNCPIILHPPTGKNVPLRHERIRWKSDMPLTESQVRSKREEFWDTAPAFEGRREIWDALKAAALAIETHDYNLAQAIIDGANITLPNEIQFFAMLSFTTTTTSTSTTTTTTTTTTITCTITTNTTLTTLLIPCWW
ncbi:Ubiquitin domain-containing protein 2 [Portunus trituberculatus]|uniref:Ubiquitin domain-containing protein 2 n=1 Tax=Portunus trituberculatus TaxID=210409 RepID=A0A5B7DWB6_PORTR|nr:Ubiquitin domain-containing protein 2 [Portunus trituberculatus]